MKTKSVSFWPTISMKNLGSTYHSCWNGAIKTRWSM